MLSLLLTSGLALAFAGNNKKDGDKDHKSQCKRGRNYAFEGRDCHLWGDPHFTTFSGKEHDYQGHMGKHYYYVARCADKYPEDMPFALAGDAYNWGNGPAQGLNYFTLELFDKQHKIHYVYFSTGILATGKKDDGATIDYDKTKKAKKLKNEKAGKIRIADEFTVDYIVDKTNLKIHLYLYVDGCSKFALKVEMHGEYNKVGNVWKMHACHIEVGQSYKCSACGLCGDFQLSNSELKDCFGNPKKFSDGMGRHQGVYDEDGWTYEYNYYKDNCEVDEDPCAVKRDLIKDVCDEVREDADVEQCCGMLRDRKFCDDLRRTCEEDICLADGLAGLSKAQLKAMAVALIKDDVLDEDECQRPGPAAKAAPMNVFETPEEDFEGDDFEGDEYGDYGYQPEDISLPQGDDKWTLEITAADLTIFGLVLANAVIIALSVRMCLKNREKKVAYGIVDGVTTDDEV